MKACIGHNTQHDDDHRANDRHASRHSHVSSKAAWQIYTLRRHALAFARVDLHVTFSDDSPETVVYNVLLYYQFVRIDDTDAFADAHRQLCMELGLKGRILVAPEGLNGTVSGPKHACDHYRSVVSSEPRFASMIFKVDEASGHAFEKLFVRVKKELVTFRADLPSDPNEITGKRLTPTEWKERIEKGDVIILDGRTDYEYDIGHFRGAIRPDCQSFREFPEWIRTHLADARHKPILTYCTGGIRCEKLTSFMLRDGFTDVYQLDGGIVSYGKDPDTKGALWDGLCYVFDERATVEINHTEDRRITGRCHHCGEPAERYVDCRNYRCHLQHIACDECERQFNSACSIACMDAPERPWYPGQPPRTNQTSERAETA